ncbi:MAG: polysaccharide deacetylase family protein [Steroidobacteraceae bacterium]
MNRIPKPAGALLRTVAGALSPAGSRAGLLTLIFHRVVAEHDPMNADEPDATEFAARLDLLGEIFQIMTLREAAARMESGSLPARAACITFDDGYENNCSIAAKILAARGMSATFFIATGFLETGCMWNDVVIEAIRRCDASLDLEALGLGRHDLPDDSARARLAGELLVKLKYLPQSNRLQLADAIAGAAGGATPRNLMMSEAQIRQLVDLGMEVGAHTVSHPILANLDDSAARQEICESKDRLEAITGSPVSSFAYPNGRPVRDYRAVHVRLVHEAGFHAAVSTAWGCARSGTDRYQLPRVSPWDRTATHYALRLVRSYVQGPAQLA